MIKTSRFPRAQRGVTRSPLYAFLLVMLLLGPSAGKVFAGHCDTPKPISLLTVIDRSSSMGNKLQDARDFAVDYMEALIAESETDLAETKRINFCEVILGGSSWGGGPAGTIAVINNDGNETCTGASDGTGLFHAIDFAADDLKQRSASNLRLLVVISDGVDSTTEDESVAVNALSGGSIVTRLVYIGTGTSPFTSIVNSVSGSNIDDFSITSDNLDDLVDDIVDAARCVNTAPTPKITLDTEFRLGVEGFRNDFQNNSTDIDDGPGAVKVERWELFKPDGTPHNQTTSLANSWSPLLTDDELPEENWRVKLTVEDSDGLKNSVSEIFRVIGSPPNISINSGPVTAGDPIELSVSPTSDVDGGDFVSIIWAVLQSPVDAQFAPQSGIGTGLVLDPIDTTDQDIGTWEFKVTVTDDEETSGFAEVIVDVVNAPPEIELDWPEEVDVGQPITAMTTVIDDVDGGVLTFDWGIIQAPQSAPLTEQPQEGFSGGSAGAGSALASIDTVEAHAGTWIFRLTATDDDQAQNSVVEEEFEVLVDGLPEATITCLSCRDPDAVSHGDIGSASFPLVLDSGESFDPDSPPPPPCPVGGLDKCHNTLDGRQVFLSEGLTRVWSLIDFPGDLLQPIRRGRVDDNEVFGVTATGSKLTLDITDLEPGDWTFEVEVEDGEDNEEFSTFDVRVVEENGPPKVNLSAPARYTTDLSSILEEDIVLSGFLSLDPDNILEILDGTDLEPGSGITDYLWEILEMPSGCSQLPTLPSGPNEDTVNLYTADTVIDSACQGNWRIKLTVTDDDLLPRTASAETIVIIGNCAQPLCVDLPTNANPLFVEFSEGTDIFIYYHLDSALYEDPSFDFGMVSVVEIYHESDLSTPVYTAPPDYNVQGSGKGSSLVFHWNGYGNSPTGLTSIDSPQSGLYTVNITLYRYEEDATLGFVLVPTAFTATEINAIWIEVIEPIILPASDKYINFDELQLGVDTITLHYELIGGPLPDELCWRVKDAANAELITECITQPSSSDTIDWNGLVGVATILPGQYNVELEAFRDGVSLGKSEPSELIIYRMGLSAGGVTLPISGDGTTIYVNDDDDNKNNVQDLGEKFAAEPDLKAVSLILEPPELLGELKVSKVGALGDFKVWDSPNKATETALEASYLFPGNPFPASVFLEATAAGNPTLRLEFHTLDGITLPAVDHLLNLVSVEVFHDTNDNHTLDLPGDKQAFFLQIGHLEDAYRPLVPPAVPSVPPAPTHQLRKFADPNNFIDRDKRRFYIRVENPAATGAGTTDIKIASPQDADTVIRLNEMPPGSGVFISSTQLITTIDATSNHDDTESTPDSAGSLILDEVMNDRSHKAKISDDVRLKYTALPTELEQQFNLPVCLRAPDYRRKVLLDVIVFNEPYIESNGVPGYQSGEMFRDFSTNAAAPYASGGVRDGIVDAARVAQDIDRANVWWAQNCIEVVQSSLKFEEAPQVGGLDIHHDAVFSNGGPEESALLSAHLAAANVDHVTVFYVMENLGWWGLSRTPSDNPAISVGDKSLMYLTRVDVVNRNTLAHELGHCMDNEWDAPADEFIIYPNDDGNGFLDTTINRNRRFKMTKETDFHTDRDSLGATGNLLRQPY